MRRTFLIGLAVIALAGCGDGQRAAAPRDAADMIRANHSPEAVWLQRVIGDDPVSESVSLREDGTVAVRRGGGRGYWDVLVDLSPDEAARALRLVKQAPFAALADNTIEPGGFGGNDNGIRYMLRRGDESVTVAADDLPPRMRRLVAELNAMIDGERGRIIADDRHFSASGVTGADASDDDATAPEIESSPATPVTSATAPAPQLALSCYGEGDREPAGEPPAGLAVGPLVLAGLDETSRGRVIEAPAIVAPGGAATVAVAPRDRDRAGLLYGRTWRGPHRVGAADHTIRFEGCSDSTSGGGAARFAGGLVVTGKGCTTLLVHAAGRGEPERRRVACRR